MTHHYNEQIYDREGGKTEEKNGAGTEGCGSSRSRLLPQGVKEMTFWFNWLLG